VAQPNAITGSIVLTQVVGEAVRSGAGVADVSGQTSAVVTGDQVRAIAAIKTRL